MVGAKYAISVGAAAATVGIIIGVVTLTGVGFKLSTIITGAAADLAACSAAFVPASLFDAKAMTLFFTLVMTAIVCILLGCGMPTTANYIIMVTIAAPALAMLGVAPLVSHFFVFYYGVLADITPPVALAAYAGASMAGADPFKTGNTAFRLGLAKALVPFVFVYSPAMLLVTKGFHLGRILRNDGRLHRRHRHAGRRAYRLWLARAAELGAALAGLRVGAGHFAEPHRDADRPGHGRAGSLASARGLASRAIDTPSAKLSSRRPLSLPLSEHRVRLQQSMRLAPLGLFSYLAYRSSRRTSRDIRARSLERQMTYSIAARCPDTGAFGIAITSSSICVASRCAWVGPLGAVSTQNVTDPALGPAGLALLRQGLGAGAVLDLLLAGTPEPEWRQVGVIDRYGKTALHSGKEALADRGLRQGRWRVLHSAICWPRPTCRTHDRGL